MGSTAVVAGTDSILINVFFSRTVAVFGEVARHALHFDITARRLSQPTWLRLARQSGTVLCCSMQRIRYQCRHGEVRRCEEFFDDRALPEPAAVSCPGVAPNQRGGRLSERSIHERCTVPSALSLQTPRSTLILGQP